MTTISGSFTLSDTEGVEKLFEDEGNKLLLQARSDAISLVDEMKKLLEKGINPDTQIYVWGKQIMIEPKEEYKEPDPEVHQSVIQVMLDETGSLAKKRDTSWWPEKYPDRVRYKGMTSTGVELQYVAVPPGCRVEEREVTIPAKPAEPERVVKKRVLICQGPQGETEEVIE